MNNSSTGAIYGQGRYRVVPPEQVSGETEDKNEQAIAKRVETNREAALASLVTHPGWEILEELILNDIAQYKSGAKLAELVAGKEDFAKLGEKLYTEMTVAARINHYVQLVHNAHTAIEQEKERNRAAARRNRGA